VSEYSLAKTGEYPRVFPNFQNPALCKKDLKDNKHFGLNLGRKYVRIFALGKLFGTDNVCRQIS